jgi:Bacterial lectin/MBG domain (YGX type)/Divergent InlB B-repeat domain/Abnormal spindle-like microcephaly-assoc'd, ASPM-SPD-2-Hydin
MSGSMPKKRPMKIYKSESATGKTSARKREFMKLGITKFVIVAAIAVLVVASGSTAAWAQAQPCPTSPSYTSNFSSNQTCLALNPSSGTTPTFTTPPVALQLTSSSSNQTGSAWYGTPQVVENGFTTTFQFQLTNPSNPPADGIAFVIQSYSSTAIGYTGGNGGALGYGDADSNANPSQGGGIPKSLAIEFDTFENAWDPAPNPTTGSVSHVAVQSCGTGPNTSHHNYLCGGTSGANSTLGAPAYTPNLADGNPHTVTITYYPVTASTPANIHVMLDGTDLYPNGVDVDLASIGLAANGTAYVGFTGATGGDSETQDILSWTFTPASNTLTLTELGLGAGTVTDGTSAINCSEANGANTGTPCSATYPGGTLVTLTETPTGGSTFGGWGGACSGTSVTCTVTMDSAQNVTASFVAPPTTTPIVNACSAQTNVTGTANYCPNNPNPISPSNPCTDPNGVQFSVSIPVVSPPSGQCLALSVTATEVKGDGLCPAGGTGESSDFDCRMVNFYNYGTDPATGSTVTPLCYPYSNGNCTFYSLALTGGGVPPSSFYSGGVYWQVAFNNVFAPQGSYWAGSTPSLLDDPGEDEIPPLPFGTDCNTAMSPSAGQPPPNPPIFCQFDNNITTFYQPGGTSFDPVGGKSQQLNDVVVTFLPTSVGTGGTPPTTVAPMAVAVNCVGTPAGCTTGSYTVTFTEGTGGTAAATSIGPGTPPTPPYPTPTVTAVTTNATGIAAVESTNLVTLTTTGSFGPQAVPGNTVMVTNCTPAAFNGTFAIVAGTGTLLSYSDSSSGLGTGTGCQALVLPNGLTFNAPTGLLAGTPLDGTAGSYPITFTSTNSAGFTTLNDTLTVSPAGALTITASNGTMTYGGTVPTITPSGSGFVNGDTIASLTTQPTCTTTATSTSLPGTYPSSCSGAVDANYSTIKYVPGTVTVAGIDISPLTVNFGTLYLDQLGLQLVTLKNTTTAPITITGITLGGGSANGDFGDLTFCPPMILKLPATLPAGKSCAIGVGILTIAPVFSPTASTTYLTITDSAATQQVLLTALVINPRVSLSSTNLSFGTQTLNKPSTAKVVTLTNSGTTPLQLTSLTSSSSNFTFTTTCPTTPNTTLAPTAGTCTISVTFTPTSTKNVSGTLTIRDNAANSPQVITLSGN